MKTAALTLLILIATLSVNAQRPIRVTCPRPEFKPPERQYRGEVKHRSRGGATGDPIDTAGMYALPKIATDTVNDESNDSRPVPDSAEEQTFTLDALLVQAKLEGNDCEIHLEFAQTARSTARRVIVEVTPDTDFSSDYQKILRLMQSRFTRRRGVRPGSTYLIDPPVHMKITGFGFVDGFHQARVGPVNRNGGHGTAGVKTFWELHPAWNVQCLPASACP